MNSQPTFLFLTYLNLILQRIRAKKNEISFNFSKEISFWHDDTLDSIVSKNARTQIFAPIIVITSKNFFFQITTLYTSIDRKFYAD